MLRILTFLALAFPLTAQLSLSPLQWQEDLRFLQETVNQDYPFLFKKITSSDWNDQTDRLYNVIPDLPEHLVVAELTALVAAFGYGHTSLRMDDRLGFHRLPINLYAFQDGVYIEGASSAYQQLVGSKVLKIGDTSIDEAVRLIQKVVPVENEQFHKAYGLNSLRVTEWLHACGIIDKMDKTIPLTLQKDETTFTIPVAAQKNLSIPTSYGYILPDSLWISARDRNATPHYLKELEKPYRFDYIEEKKTMYVRQSSVFNAANQSIEAFYEEVFAFIEDNGVEKLVIDLRLNGGGNNYNNKAVITELIENKSINQTGKLMVIIGRRTFSACQNLVNELSNYTNAVFIGEPTAENINFYGDNREVVLPNSGLKAYLSFAWWQDKPQWEDGPWTTPHISVDMTFDQYQNNEDPVLEAALDFNDEEFILQPMRYFEGLFSSGQIEKLQQEAVRLVSDPNYAFFHFEKEFSSAGENLMHSNMLNEAVFVFTMTAQLFPESAMLQEQLGRAYILLGDIEKAKTHLTQAVKIDPDGEIGRKAEMALIDLK